MSTMLGQRAQEAQRHEGARERRQRRLCAKARVRYRLCRNAMLLATQRGGPLWAPPVRCLCRWVCSHQWSVTLVRQLVWFLVVVWLATPVDGTLPAQSVEPTFVGSSASVVSVTDISWQEARWKWYRAQGHSPDPDLIQFLVPVVTSAAVSVGSTPQRPLLVSRFGATGFRPMKVCMRLHNRGELCSFAHSSFELHLLKAHSSGWLASLMVTPWSRGA